MLLSTVSWQLIKPTLSICGSFFLLLLLLIVVLLLLLLLCAPMR